MRGLRIPMLVVMAPAEGLTACTDHGSGYGPGSTQGMIGSKGPGYTKD